jgi:hypothetical protein
MKAVVLFLGMSLVFIEMVRKFKPFGARVFSFRLLLDGVK